MENLRYYSFCYSTETPESEYQLIMTKSMLSNGEILIPENELLFGHLFVYFGETDHVIPWQTDHLNCWRTSAADAIGMMSKVMI